jgi:hypothetical protein
MYRLKRSQELQRFTIQKKKSMIPKPVLKSKELGTFSTSGLAFKTQKGNERNQNY